MKANLSVRSSDSYEFDAAVEVVVEGKFMIDSCHQSNSVIRDSGIPHSRNQGLSADN